MLIVANSVATLATLAAIADLRSGAYAAMWAGTERTASVRVLHERAERLCTRVRFEVELLQIGTSRKDPTDEERERRRH